MVLQKIKSVVGNPNFTYAVKGYFEEAVKHPCLVSRETSKFFSHWLLGRKEKPKNGLRFEQHCHSHFSDGANLASIVNLLFDEGINLWSLTDHNNSSAFDALRTGKYDLNKESKIKRTFEVEANADGRSLVIHADLRQVVLLRSVECYTDKGEINIHGYAGKVPKQGTPFEDAIKQGIAGGGWIAINHPYFWQGLGYCGRQFVERAVSAGAKAIEKNGTEIPPQIFCPVKAGLDAREFGLALLASGDAHKLHMYGMSGLTFEDNLYTGLLQTMRDNNADVIKYLVEEKLFETYLNYLTPKQFLDFFSFD